MTTYLISYDLNRPKQDYSELHKAIKNLTGTWWHCLESTWMIKHSGSASDIRDKLKSHIDTNDELLVVKLSGEGAWRGFDSEGSDWLKTNL